KGRHGGSGSACGRCPPNAAVESSVEDDHSVLAPRASTRAVRLTEGQRWPTGQIDLFEMAACEKSDGAAVRRPEGVARVFGARELASNHGIQVANPDLILPIHVGGEGEMAAIRGQGRNGSACEIRLLG